jgi:hypothetical protein
MEGWTVRTTRRSTRRADAAEGRRGWPNLTTDEWVEAIEELVQFGIVDDLRDGAAVIGPALAPAAMEAEVLARLGVLGGEPADEDNEVG